MRRFLLAALVATGCTGAPIYWRPQEVYRPVSPVIYYPPQPYYMRPTPYVQPQPQQPLEPMAPYQPPAYQQQPPRAPMEPQKNCHTGPGLMPGTTQTNCY